MADPINLAAFSNNQWYCYQVRQTVFYACFSSHYLDEAHLLRMLDQVIELAPHLLDASTVERETGSVPRDIARQLVSSFEVGALTPYPDAWPMHGNMLFDHPDLPMVRLMAANLPDGPDEQNRRSAFLAISTHSLFEGADAVQLVRSQTTSRDPVAVNELDLGGWRRVAFAIVAAIAAPFQILLAELTVTNEIDRHYRGIAVSRARLRNLASAFNVSQRGLLYALALWCIHSHGKGFGKATLSTLLAELNPSGQAHSDDPFFQYRMMGTRLPFGDDFPSFVKDLDERIKAADFQQFNTTQLLLSAMFRAHRWLKTRLPFLYSDKTFRYAAGYDFDLSLVPPLRPAGALTEALGEPVFGGMMHPGLECCVFTPTRQFVTFNFVLSSKHLPALDHFQTMLDDIEASVRNESR
ncbi:MAG: hypothetical protein KDJ19_11770 [Hyphomicrobiaceae bacterium]|nr:hypothetical protein [Hyphomicrobiaceae bacterium]MCC0023383.1 hypothetical protein [Hyphomicrobiaceae bacterium]